MLEREGLDGSWSSGMVWEAGGGWGKDLARFYLFGREGWMEGCWFWGGWRRDMYGRERIELEREMLRY